MTTSLKTWSNYANDSDSALSVADKSYFRARTRNHVHGVVLQRFVELSDTGQLSRAKLADRLGVGRAQITRWLSSPGNWTLDTLSDLLLAMNCHASLCAEELAEQGQGNYLHAFSQAAQPNDGDLAVENEDRSSVVINFGRSATSESAGTLRAR